MKEERLAQGRGRERRVALALEDRPRERRCWARPRRSAGLAALVRRSERGP
jgi:hypothetical protein